MKALVEMSASELETELQAAIAAERQAEFVDGFAGWLKATESARLRQDQAVAEMARRRMPGAGGDHQ